MMALRLLSKEERGQRVGAVMDASRLNKGEFGKRIGVSPSTVTRLLRGDSDGVPDRWKVVAMKIAGEGFLTANEAEIWQFLEGEGDPNSPPLAHKAWFKQTRSDLGEQGSGRAVEVHTSLAA